MQHFFVPEGPDASGRIHITGADVRHIRNVLRMKPGEALVVSDGSDRDYYCLLEGFSGDEAVAVVQEEAPNAELPAQLTLYQGLPKGDKMEWIIQKAVELGVHRIVPVAMKRSVVRLDEKKAATRVSRWNSIAESAAKQSGRGYCPRVSPVYSYRQAVAEAGESGLFLLPYENARGMQATAEALEALAPGMTAAILIGPEGGFDPEETALAEAGGARLISLGRRILRTETAGIAALTLCMYRLEQQSEEKN